MRLSVTRWFAAAVLIALFCAAVQRAAHLFVSDSYARGRRALLHNLIPDDLAHPLGEYLAAADRLLVLTVSIVLVVVLIIALAPRAERWSGTAYRRIARWASRAASKPLLPALIAATILFAALAVLAVVVLQAFPNSGDEYCAVYQARTFAAGRLWNDVHPLQPFFETFHVRVLDGRVFSVFPPGWPAVLAVALRAHVFLWLVNPLLALLSLVVLFRVARHLHGGRAATVAVALTAGSAFFLFNSASLFSHTLCALFVLLYAWSAVRAVETDRGLLAFAAGIWLGAAFVTRYYTAVICAVPFAVVLLAGGRRRLPLFGWVIAGGLPFVALQLWYNHATVGHALQFAMGGGFESYDQRWFAPNVAGRGLEILGGNLAGLLSWTPPALLPLYLWALGRGAGRPAGRFLDFLFPALALGYLPYVDTGGNQYGPRYYYEAFPFIVLLVSGWLFPREEAAENAARDEQRFAVPARAFYYLAISLLLSVPLLAYHVRIERRVVSERRDLYAKVAAARISQAVVFINGRVGHSRSISPLDLTRNDPDYSQPVLYALDRGADNARLYAFYPKRAFYRYHYDAVTGSGELTQIRIRSR